MLYLCCLYVNMCQGVCMLPFSIRTGGPNRLKFDEGYKPVKNKKCQTKTSKNTCRKCTKNIFVFF